MPDSNQVALLQRSVVDWNAWRHHHPEISPDLQSGLFFGAQLRGANLRGANLRESDLARSSLTEADLSGADMFRSNIGAAYLMDADLTGTDLTMTNLRDADLRGASLRGAKLIAANLSGANLNSADLRGANLTQAKLVGADVKDVRLHNTVFADVNLSKLSHIGKCEHHGPSILDHRTLELSGDLPHTFLRGCGLPDKWIDYLPGLIGDAFVYYSCFISYSEKDGSFAKRLHADLQDNGIRCWFAPHDMRIGAKIWDSIDEAIRLREKVILILSENSIASSWVEDEVERAFAEERERETTVLFPVRIDDAILSARRPWARKILDQRHIGDFTDWKSLENYQYRFEGLLKDLAKPSKRPEK